MTDGLKDTHRDAIIAMIAANDRVERAVLFGSRATGTNTVSSDVDIALFGDRLTLTDQARLAVALDEIPMAQSVDLLLHDSIQDRTLREHIRRQGVEWYARPIRDEGYDTSSDSVSERPVVTVEDMSEKVAMGPFGSSIKVSTFVPDGVPIINGQHLHGIRLDDSPGFNFITDEHAARLANANVERGDVILTHRGNIGQVSYIPDDSMFVRYIVSQSQFYMRCDRSRVIPKFVALYFTCPEGQHQLLANASQMGVPSIAQPVTYLRTLKIPLPPLPEQRSIAHVLCTLDDKIELNRRMNATLEAMARALFRSWFVDFDPVRAKMEGRDTGLPKDIADLFPDRLVDSELGDIPQGWLVRTLGELCHKPQYGYTASARSQPVGPRFLRITDINKNPWVSWSRVPYCEATDDELSKYRLRKGDVLIARMADPGHGILVEEDVEAVFASYLIRFRPIENRDARFLQYWLKSDAYWQLVRGQAAGTTRVSLNAKVLGLFPLVVPPNGVASAFARVVGALRDRLMLSATEMQLLADLRDTLLPKLVSGQLLVQRNRTGMRA